MSASEWYRTWCSQPKEHTSKMQRERIGEGARSKWTTCIGCMEHTHTAGKGQPSHPHRWIQLHTLYIINFGAGKHTYETVQRLCTCVRVYICTYVYTCQRKGSERSSSEEIVIKTVDDHRNIELSLRMRLFYSNLTHLRACLYKGIFRMGGRGVWRVCVQ